MNWQETTSRYYGDLLAKYGAVPASVDTRRESQRMRFQVLWEAIFGRRKPSTILDVGCGYGAFVDYLIEHGAYDAADGYTGIDISPDMVASAQCLRPNRSFEARNLIEEPFDKQFEAVIACGIFQLDHGGEYVDSMIEAMWQATGRVLAFNMLSGYAPEKTEGELYCEPGRVMTYCQQMTPFVTIDHSYRQNDFTVIMTREAR